MRMWSVVIERELSLDLFPDFTNLHAPSAQVVKMCRVSQGETAACVRANLCVSDSTVVFTAAILHTKTT